MTLKQKIHIHLLQVLHEKVVMLQQVLAGLKETGANETKSTAGDKHETALAMIQIEQANIRTQLEAAYLQKAAMEKLNPMLSPTQIVQGSLIKTNQGLLYLSIAMGKKMIDGQFVTALSCQSPLGAKLLGLKAGALVEINNNSFLIESIE